MKKSLLLTLLLLVHVCAAWAADKVITGNVIADDDKQPLIGVSVYVSADDLKKAGSSLMSLGVVTDIDGNFSITVPSGVKKLQLSYIGYTTQQIELKSGQTHYNVALQPSSTMLNDVVVTGYQTVERRKLTAAVAKIDISEGRIGTVKSIDQALSGQIAGLSAVSTSGAPGSPVKIRIRGTSSLNGTQDPLWVLDGIPLEGTDIPSLESLKNIDDVQQSSIAGLNPADIADITVLKDAAATAIYGSRGANGVVIIKTKDGHRNEQMKISLGYTLSVGNQIKKFKPLNTTKFKNLQELIIKNTLGAINKAQITDDNIIYGQIYPAIDYMANTSYDNYGNMIFDGLKDEAFGEENTNWVDETNNKNALTHMYNLAIRGGGKLSNYSFSFNAIDQEGLFINDDMQRYNSRLSFDSDVSKRFKVGAALGYTMTKRHSGAAGEEMGITREWNVRPDVPVYDETGELYRIDGTPT